MRLSDATSPYTHSAAARAASCNALMWCGMPPSRQGHLLKQKRFTARWVSHFFRLEDGYLTHYEKKSLVGTKKNKVKRPRYP